MRRAPVAAGLGLVLLCGCASLRYPENPPLSHWDETAGYRLDNLALGEGNTDSTFVIVTLSGGGTRAAAFAYGVLETLSKTPLEGGRSLLDEVDVLSSVSGGSFAAAYYGLYGKERFLERFPADVLYRKIVRAYVLRLLSPWNWPGLLSPWFGRSDLADAYYGKHIYAGKTFGDLPRRRPFLVINAADMSLGAQLSFTQEHFDRLCSDLSGVALSRAVAASSAFPIVFTPLTLKNRPKESCGYTTPDWVTLALEHDLARSPARHDLAKTWKAYEDASARPYVHLVDGGIADNIGLRGPAHAITTTDSEWSILSKVDLQEIDRLAVIVVDAKPAGDVTVDGSARPPSFVSVLDTATTSSMENYSADSVEILRKQFVEWEGEQTRFEARRERCDAFAPERKPQCYATFHLTESDRPHPVEVYEIHVRFEALSDPVRRERVAHIPTSLQLPEEDVELLIEAAGEILAGDAEYRRLVADLAGGP